MDTRAPSWLVRWLAVATLVGLHHALGPWARPPDHPRPPTCGALRIATWNLRNFPQQTLDPARLQAALANLDADVLVLQEVHDPDALAGRLADHVLVASRGGGRHGQRLVVAYDPDVVQPTAAMEELDALSLGGRVRPGVVLPLSTPVGPLTIVGVHLKAGRDGWPDRRRQWTTLHAALSHLVATGAPVLVAGDFNVVGGREAAGPDAAGEWHRLAARMRSVGLAPALDVGQCTAYWEGVRRDGWWVGSGLDQIFVSAGIVRPGARAWVGSTCARHDCDPVHNSEAFPDPDLGGVSDHCPVLIELGELDDCGVFGRG